MTRSCRATSAIPGSACPRGGPHASINRSVSRDNRTTAEAIIDPSTNDVVGHVVAGRDGRERSNPREGAADAAEIDVEIFELEGPIVPQRSLDASANRPARMPPIRGGRYDRTARG